MLVQELSHNMLVRTLLILPIMLSYASRQVPTYSVAGLDDSPSIVTLRHKLNSGDTAAIKNFWDAVHHSGAPLIEAAPDLRFRDLSSGDAPDGRKQIDLEVLVSVFSLND